MEHLIVSRFSVPRLDAATADFHRDETWLAGRLELFRRFFVPSVERLGVPAILLCSSASAERVAEATQDLAWVRVEVQDDWYGGWSGGEDQMLTRLDSDDAVHEGWLRALEAAPEGYEAYVTTGFYRYDADTGHLYQRRRREPSPLAAFPGGRNPYRWDHAELPERCRICSLPRTYLLQVVHGGNLSNRRPSWRHIFHRRPLEHLRPFHVGL